jgi:hypothetical protein
MQLTFKGFLKQYVRELSYQDTNNIYKLVRETTKNPRLYEPLFLYANVTNKAHEFHNAVKKTPDFNKTGLLNMEIDENFTAYSELPAEYAKVYETFLYHKNKAENDNFTKRLMHKRIQTLQTEKGVTNYKICKDLSINMGNFGAFMKNEDMSKCGLDLLRKIIDYLERQ